jgi:hypothetical protein
MRNTVLLAITSALALSGYVTTAEATDYNYSGTIDATSGVFESGELVYDLPAPSLNLALGDTVSGTFTFANNQEVSVSGNTLNSSDVVQLGINASNTDAVTTSGTFTLLGVQGSLTSANPAAAGSAGSGIASGFYQYYPEDSNFSFSGFAYSLSITSETSTYTTGGASFIVSAPAVSFGEAPEPTIWALLLGGLGLLALRQVRTRQRRITAS